MGAVVEMSVHLLLVRHGATDWSDAGRFCGWADVPLNARGREEARSLRRGLEGRRFAGVWTSDLTRAAETARLAGRRAAPDARLRELDFGNLEGMRWEDCPVPVRDALLEFDDFLAPGGESVSMLRARVTSFVQGLLDGEHLVFTHGGVIRLFAREMGQVDRIEPGGLRSVAL
jgi:probable phosphoglycerate mutase